MNHTPIMLNLHGRPAVVIGAGKVAARRSRWLLEAGARVTVVAPEAGGEIRTLAGEGKLHWRKKAFEPADLHDAWVVVAATDSAEVNRKVAEAAGSRQLVNVVDRPSLGNFHVPVRLNRGRLTLSVSTGGASPFLARMIRDELAEQYDESWREKLDRLYREREKIRTSGLSEEEKRRRLRRLAEED
ncbi:precorrin-2 dehydrogenase/sirohydrochlorin ferrochelatase [Melghirimyces profundicolus]|uniref:precorrin-2 dehydrogenase n=1 Tax=Melghirimyces profundicolus TaxID=1242148 RepID=A0A2T6C4K3_9BACL|nr:NAD(P)-dependent oxidoreductase [Melghirimyces profundicolus]PTX63238.1 precorrin-2 dehydrogenase/sirohydrochlorin ferrochelatase [Melghirimyces profundicolus]